MHNPFVRKTLLAQGIALALGVAVVPHAFAQAEETTKEKEQVADNTTIDEIIVTGFRQSLVDSMDIRRQSNGVVDAITAIDIGKFPDQNLAEALQRIPGVSINRVNNEGSQITVRGFGPEFNLVTLNGRSMPTAGSRSFDFNDLATEGVKSVEVYKTSDVSMPTGGIGATVNISTPRPLDRPGFTGVISGKGVHETSSSDSQIRDLDRVTPEVAGLYSQTFADDKFGVLISASFQSRDNREEFATVDNWRPNTPLREGATVVSNNQREDGTYWHPQNIGYGWNEVSRDRINAQGVLQYAPTDRFTATLDYTYSELETESDSNSVGVWFEDAGTTNVTINERGTVVNLISAAPADYATNIARNHTIKENNSLGLNLEWQATDSLKFALDAHSSSSELSGGKIAGEPGSSANLIIGNTGCPWCADAGPEFGPATASIDQKSATFTRGGIPLFDVSFVGADGNPQDFLLPSDLGSLFGQAFNTKLENDIDQLQLQGTWDNLSGSSLSRVDFGYSRTEQEFRNRNAFSGQLPAGFWLTSAQYWPNDGWETGNLGGLLNNFSNGGNFSQDQFYTVGFDTAVNQFETIGVGDPIEDVFWPGWPAGFQDPSGERGRFWSGPLGNNGDARVEETIDAFYAQALVEEQVNGMPFTAVLGLRYEDTEVKSTGLEVPATAIVWVGGNEFAYERASEPTPRSATSDNKFWLPSISTSLEFMQDMIGRAAYSRTISRPPIGALGPNRDFIGNPTARNRQVNAGNPDLLPFVSDNLDLAVEYYYAPGSYVSVGHFRKRVDNFLVSTTVQDFFAGLNDPFIGADAQQARAELAEENIPVTDANVFQRINENLGVPITTPVRARPDDPLAEFNITTTDNLEIGNVHGWELALQHLFANTGWGVQANATFVSGDVDADREVLNQSFALPGLSDSRNLSVFYENQHISTRLAYNWRDEFLGGFDQFGAPVYTEAYEQFDFILTWFATDRLAVFVEGINITEETQRTYTRYKEQLLAGNQFGARYSLGARYKF
ncbi:MAG: TonB-dependent receptor [Wenzhouxiangella sp.]